jgi:hypothetical protein
MTAHTPRHCWAAHPDAWQLQHLLLLLLLLRQ